MKRNFLTIIFCFVSLLLCAEVYKSIDWKNVDEATFEHLKKYIPKQIFLESCNIKGCFWYCERTNDNTYCYSFDALKKRKKLLFDTKIIATKYNEIEDKNISWQDVYVTDIVFENGNVVLICFKGKYWKYNIKSYSFERSNYKKDNDIINRFNDTLKYTHDSLFVITGFNNNIYLKRKNDKFFSQITIDGTKEHSFNSYYKDDGISPIPTNAHWIPGTHTFYHLKIDKSKIKETPLVKYLQNGRPIVELRKMPMPADSILTMYSLIIYNADNKKYVSTNLNKYNGQKVELKFNSKLNDLGDNLFLTRIDRGYRYAELCRVNSVSGDLEVVISDETLPHFNVQLFNSIIFEKGKKILWWSEKNGYGQYFLYNNKGKLLNMVTPNSIVAGRVIHIDKKNGFIIFEGYNRKESSNPSYRYYYKVGLNGKGLTLLTPQDGMHTAELSKDGLYLIDTYSKMDLLPIYQVVNIANGKNVEVYRTSDELLKKNGWKAPILLKLKAADDSTNLYGIMYVPNNLDTTKKYPIISNVYPGPQNDQIPLSFTIDDNYNQSLAELGFVVINVAPRGSSIFRGRDFHCFGYGNLRDYPLADDKYCIEQLAEKYGFIDLERVGIYGHSGGGFMTAAAMMTYPNFYKVGIAASGNHDNNIYINWWADVYNGVGEKIPTNMEIAKNLKGRLLLITGDMDRNVPPFSTYKLADALIKANKNFDMLIIPGADHYLDSDYYFNKIRYYFLEHLLGVKVNDIDIVKHK